ncbi:MAG: hypothetical protein DCC75_12290 [Proteobacteria bacterium]|nr:MAG: hypothetical protein DCC75_12290 [Pseudomonadota bacterium]
MKRDFACKTHELFRSEGFDLIVSGAGKIESAVATSLILIDSASSFAVNFGICAGPAKEQLGEIYLVNKIVDQSSGKSHFPDVLQDLALKESALTTVDMPASDAELHKSLVDMEGAGFFLAARKFLSPDKIVCLKLVTDLCKPEDVSVKRVEQLISAKFNQLKRILEQLASFDRSRPAVLERAFIQPHEIPA